MRGGIGKRPPLCLLAALTLALIVAGCGGGGDTTSTSAPGSSTSAAVAPQTPSRNEAESSAEEDKGGEASIEEFGSEASGSDKEEILAVFTGYLQALADKDYERACADLSETVQASLAQLAGKGSKANCAELLPALLAPTASQVARQQANGDVTKVRVQGERAFVVFRAPGAKLYQQTMVQEGGEWKAATVAAAVLVPEL